MLWSCYDCVVELLETRCRQTHIRYREANAKYMPSTDYQAESSRFILDPIIAEVAPRFTVFPMV